MKVKDFSHQKELEQAIVDYNKSYREGNLTISDNIYDALVDQLKINYPDSELLKKPVLEQPKQSRKQKLPLKMASLNKCKSVEEIVRWAESKDLDDDYLLVLTPKYDGISLVVNERNDDCWTRGDGEYGQYSKAHYLQMNKGDGKTIYEDLHYSFGEAIMRKDKFAAYKEDFANPRNLVAGLFNRDIAMPGLQDTDYIRYGSDMGCDKVDQLRSLNILNDVKVPYTTTAIREIVQSDILEKVYKEWSVDYQIDGIVIDVNWEYLRERLGREENGNPAYARAYKNPEWSGSDVSKVTGITWKVSKQGRLKPVVQIEPTVISGVTITNVTGYNAKYVFDNNIAIDSMIKVVRSGDVIPKHIETIDYNQSEVEILSDDVTMCPSCGEPVKWDETFTELVCVNEDCTEKRIAKLVHFFSTVGIEDFGEPSIRRFYEEDYDTVDKILNMDSTDMVTISGFGVSSSSKLLKQFKVLREEGISFAKLLHALDVMEGRIGEKTIQLILDNVDWGDINKSDIIAQVDGIADKTAEIFIRGLERFWHEEYELYLPVYIKYVKSPKQEVIGDKFKDENICFTGCRPSGELKSEIEVQGGNIVSGVSGKTTMLVVKNMSEKVLSSSKAKKAKDLGIKIVEISSL